MYIVQQEVNKFLDHIFTNCAPIYRFARQCLHDDAQEAESHLWVTFKGVSLF